MHFKTSIASVSSHTPLTLYPAFNGPYSELVPAEFLTLSSERIYQPFY